MSGDNWNFLVSATPAGAMSQAFDILAKSNRENARRNGGDSRDYPRGKRAGGMKVFLILAAGLVGVISATGITISWLT